MLKSPPGDLEIEARRNATRPIAPLAAALVLALAGSAAAEPGRTAVVLLFDGFAPPMLELAETPHLDRMAREGVSSRGFVPAFPTISLINGVTVSTGCWPARHGIVTNVFEDPERGRYDHSGDADWLTGCEHLHQAAERQGMASAAIGWVGAHSETLGAQASWVMPRSEHVCGPGLEGSRRRDEARTERVVELLERGAGPRLVLGYFCGPDGAAHFRGTDTEETREEVARADAIVGRVLDAVARRPDADRVSVFVVTDHGMRPISHLVNIARIVRKHDIPATPVSTGTTSFLYFDDPSQVDRAAATLSEYDQFEVLRRDALPEYAHLGEGPRVGELIVSAHPPYFIEDVGSWPWWTRWLEHIGPSFVWARFSLKETHGYPPDTEGMHGVFFAWGAGVAHDRTLPRVRNVDVHPTVTHLLGIGPGRPVDGTLAAAILTEGESP